MRCCELIVRGGNVLAPPLLQTKDAKAIEFYDSDGKILCFWRRVFSDNTKSEMWGFVTRSDPDFEEMCIRYGYKTISPNTTIKTALEG